MYQDDRRSLAERVEGYVTLGQARALTQTPTDCWFPPHERPTTSPFSSTSMRSAAGWRLKPGMVLMSPQIG